MSQEIPDERGAPIREREDERRAPTHHVDRRHDGEHGPPDDCRLEQFRRNRYFHGKLMTARDMGIEQEYHADRLETLAQHVAGEGVVCGLATTVTQETPEDDLTVTVDPGVALDCCGRPVVLEDPTERDYTDEDFPPDADPAESGISLYLRLDECRAQKVPVPGSQDACAEDCEYNHVIEQSEVVVDPGPPASRKPIPPVEFPTREEIARQEERLDEAADEGRELRLADPGYELAESDVMELREHVADGVSETNPALSKIARSYHRDESADGFRHLDCDEGGDPSVFLGFYTREGDAWELREVDEPRHYVYSNDMLYSAIAHHTADFGNPHDVVDTVEGLDGHVGVVSPDGTIDVDADSERNRVELEAGAWHDTVGQYVADKALKTTVKSFLLAGFRHRDLGLDTERPFEAHAFEVAERAREALLDRDYEDEQQFYAAVRDVASMAEWFATEDQVARVMTDESIDRFEEEHADLVEHTSGLPDEPAAIDPSALELSAVAYDLDQLAEAAQWLETPEEFANWGSPTHGGRRLAGITGGLPTYATVPLLLDFDLLLWAQLTGFGGQTDDTTNSTVTTGADSILSNLGAGMNVGGMLEYDVGQVVDLMEANDQPYVVETRSPDDLDETTQPGTVISQATESADGGQRYVLTVAGTDPTEVSGVGTSRAGDLATENIYTAEQLAGADSDTVARALEVDAETADGYIQAAKTLVGS